jgi:hypothetical protein
MVENKTNVFETRSKDNKEPNTFETQRNGGSRGNTDKHQEGLG